MVRPVIPESFRERPFARQRFEAIAGWAGANHPFYSRRVSGDTPEFTVLTRAEVQEHNELLLNGHPETAHTSGSTAMPVRVSWSPMRARQDYSDNVEYVRWLGGQLPDVRLLAMHSQAANANTMDITRPVAEQVEFILRRQREGGACSLVTYPSNLEYLCRHVVDNGIDMGFIRRLVCLSEVYEPWMDELAAEAFPNAARSVTYSSVEFGLIAARCPHRPDNYHIMAHKLGVEFLDDEGLPCREGETGQVVITDYINRNSTLIRYALGDLAAPATCDCGRIQLPAMTKVVGKVRSVLKDMQGRPVLFSALTATFRDAPEVRQFQVVQHAIGRFVVRYVPRADMDIDPFFARVRTRFDEVFGGAPGIEFEAREEIPRSAGGKYHHSICEV